MKKILGLDLGTNSIGWALINQNFEKKEGSIIGMGSRIIPMSQDILGDFGKGNSVSQTAERTSFRSIRRLRERQLLRRERLHRVLNVLNFLPKHYASMIDFEKNLGKFKDDSEPKLAYNNNKFLFKNSFNEMLCDFQKYQPQILNRENGENKLVPYDWTIYYLRKKALNEKIEKEELAWLLLHFNQKRGYYQLRGEEQEENPNKKIEFHSLKIVDVVAQEKQKGKNETWYYLNLENGWVYKRSSKTPLFDWKDKVRDFIVTTDLNEDGSIKKDKDGIEKRSFRAPAEGDWTLVKKKTEFEIENSCKTIGEYIYDALLQKPQQKIKGKLIRTIERKYYKSELNLILNKQRAFHPELQSEDSYIDCIRELYKSNDAHQLQLNKKDIIHLFIDDIIFYQRPLKSQKALISNCTLESRTFKDKLGNEKTLFLKSIPKSNPIYQEFRIWQWIYNLSIYKKDDDTNVTNYFFERMNHWEDLFEFINNRKEVDQKSLMKFLLVQKSSNGKISNAEIEKYRWNYVEDKAYPCNETKSLIISRLQKVDGINITFLTKEIEHQLWHIIYSITDKEIFEKKALPTFAKKHNLDIASFVDAFKRVPPFKSEYGSFSEKAIKKLLPLLRLGKYWTWDEIDANSKDRIRKILSGEYDKKIKDRVREKSIHLIEETHFQGIQLWLAQYIVYDRHTEGANIEKWNTVEDLENYLQNFRQHSLRNPIVEQVITESLRVVKDIWKYYGKGAKDYFDEIHIELGREMKNPADARKHLTEVMNQNENTNIRIKLLLAEMANDSNVENVRPYSPSQQEILKIFEDGVINSDLEIDDDILKISKTAQPSQSELRKYKLWLEQKYRSPYTGAIIPLNKLFTPEYEIEHIIPQSIFFDNSFNNKVICESAVNKLKDNSIGLAFIKKHHGEIVQCGMGKTVKIFEIDAYYDFIKTNYAKNRNKRNNLMLEDIPEQMIARQLNDTRFISKYISNILSNIVRTEKNDDGINSKNIVPGNGKITTELKQDWGLNDVWNELILPRFERLNKIKNTTNYTTWNVKLKKHLPTVPIEESKGFTKKRIDHRHHAMDALVIACATRNHVNLLNNKSANSTERYDLNKKLKKLEKTQYTNQQTGESITRDIPKEFLKPWGNFTAEAKQALENIIVSFKQNIRVINKTVNKYEKWINENGELKKASVKQEGKNWAIRKPLHKETVSGKVDLPRIKVPKGKVLTATRKNLDTSFDLNTIESITDTGIQKILKNYLSHKINNPEIAFSPEGIEDLNKNIAQFNDGKSHQPIYKVRIFELGSKFALGASGNKKSKYVETAKGTNLFFAVFIDENGKRSFETIPLNEVIERKKQGLSPVAELNDKGHKLSFHLSPNDLVYLPTDEEKQNEKIENYNLHNIYKVVSFTSSQIFFIKHNVAVSIVNKNEFSTLNKMEKSIDDKMIKDTCIKLSVNRIGELF